MALQKPITLQFDIRKLESKSQEFTFNNDKDSNIITAYILDEYVPKDLTGLTIKFLFKDARDNTYEIDGTITDATNGICTAKIPLDAIRYKGYAEIQLKLIEGTTELRTGIVKFYNELALDDAGSVVPSNQLPNYKTDLVQVQNDINNVNSDLQFTKGDLNTEKQKIDANIQSINLNAQNIQLNKDKGDNLQQQMDNVVAGGTQHDAYVVQALVDSEGTNFNTLKAKDDSWEKRTIDIENDLKQNDFLMLNPGNDGKAIYDMPNGSLDNSMFKIDIKGTEPQRDISTNTLLTSATNYDFVSRGKNLINVYKIKARENAPNNSVTPLADGTFILKGDYYANYYTNSIKVGDKVRYTSTAESITGTALNDYRLRYVDGTLSTIAHSGSTLTAIKEVERIFLYNAGENSSTVKYSNAILEIDKGQALGVYEPYQEDATNIALPRPLVKISDTVYDEINSDGDLNYRISEMKEYSSYTKIEPYSNNKHWLISNEKFTDLSGLNPSQLNAGGINIYGYDTVFSGYDNVDIQGKMFINSDGTVRYVTSLNVNDISNIFPIKLQYQLAQSETIHDGEQGYQAPLSLQTYQGGSLMQVGIHKHIYTLSNQNTIALSQKVTDITSGDYGIYELNKNYKVLSKINGATISSDGLTITLPRSIDKSVLVYGELDNSLYLYNELHANIPSNLGTAISTNSNSIVQLNDNIARINNELDLVIVATI